jgi:diguanylate cyclase (GGDEF)-like protein/PAS domain S-box-containing protein
MENALMHHASIVESSEDAIIGKTLEGIVTSWNRGAEKVFGFSREEALGQHISMMIPPAYQKAEDDVLALVRQGITQTHYQTVGCRKDGRLIDISATLSPMRDMTGRIVGVAKIARDITEHKRIEQEIRIAATAFEAQEGMMVTDANNIILRVNPAFCLNTGYTAQEAIGQHVSLLHSGRHTTSFYADMWATIARVGFWQGEIWNRRKNGEVYPEWLTITAVKAPNGATTHYVGTHTDITSRKAAEDEIRHLAFYDPLTRLPNRRLLIDRLHHALATASRMERLGALMFIDLDKFKTLNDTFGHDKGDLLLQQVAERLLTCVREGDTVARLGGDEFVVILEVLSEDTPSAIVQADSLGRNILTTLGQTYLLAGQPFDSKPSIGVTLFGPRASSAQELLKEADIAMYESKAVGGNTLRFFTGLG